MKLNKKLLHNYVNRTAECYDQMAISETTLLVSISHTMCYYDCFLKARPFCCCKTVSFSVQSPKHLLNEIGCSTDDHQNLCFRFLFLVLPSRCFLHCGGIQQEEKDSGVS